MNRWKDTPTSPRNMTPTPVPPPVLKRPEPVAPPIQAKPKSLPPTSHPRTPLRLVAVSFLQKTMLTALLVTAGIGSKIVWNNYGELNSIYAQPFFDRASYRQSDHPREKSVIAFESRTLNAADRVVTPIADESNKPESPVVDNAKRELVAGLDEQQPANIDVVESESSKVDVAPAKVNVGMVIARTQTMFGASSEDIPESEVAKSIADSSTTTPVETILAAYNASPQDEPDFTETDVDGQTTCADQRCNSETCAPSRKFGTAIEWAEGVKQAAQLAKEQEKLVFLIQVSGNFALEGFT